jgi:hypothetical protein
MIFHVLCEIRTRHLENVSQRRLLFVEHSSIPQPKSSRYSLNHRMRDALSWSRCSADPALNTAPILNHLAGTAVTILTELPRFVNITPLRRTVKCQLLSFFTI